MPFSNKYAEQKGKLSYRLIHYEVASLLRCGVYLGAKVNWIQRKIA
jgi:hypothetical protein